MWTPGTAAAAAAAASAEVGSDADWEDFLLSAAAKAGLALPPAANTRPAEALRARLGRGALAPIVLHTANLAEEVLKASGVKLHAARKRAKLSDFNHGAFAKGKEDAASINLNQRAIGR